MVPPPAPSPYPRHPWPPWVFLKKLAALAVGLGCLSCHCQSISCRPPASPGAKRLAANFTLAKTQVRADLATFSAHPHPFGSQAQAQLRSWLTQRMLESGLAVGTQAFVAATPNPLSLSPSSSRKDSLIIERSGQNLLARAGLVPSPACYVLVASHYDSKDIREFPYHGANDGGSSTVLLLHLLTYLQAMPALIRAKLGLNCDIMGVWFDGEEAILAAWDDGLNLHPARITDHTYGSRHFTAQMPACWFQGQKARCLIDPEGHHPPTPVVSLILLDLVGTAHLRLTNDTNSSPLLRKALVEAAAALELSRHLSSMATAVADDHLPFLAAGIAAVNLIDFEDLSSWHQAHDQASQVSVTSMEVAGKLAIYLSLAIASQPQAFFSSPEGLR